jgi:hypothetical protein
MYAFQGRNGNSWLLSGHAAREYALGKEKFVVFQCLKD